MKTKIIEDLDVIQKSISEMKNTLQNHSDVKGLIYILGIQNMIDNFWNANIHIEEIQKKLNVKLSDPMTFNNDIEFMDYQVKHDVKDYITINYNKDCITVRFIEN